MDNVFEFLDDALRLRADHFALKHGGLYLLKPPTASDQGWDEDIDFKTGVLSTSSEPAADLGLDPTFAGTWRISVIRKRPGNPFPDRISIGRARNCDVVLRLSFVSKLHAVVLQRPDGSFALVDQGSANGTCHNGRKLDKGDPAPLNPGDKLEFGSLGVQLVDAAMLYETLRGLANR